jgi:predicted small secreted protein
MKKWIAWVFMALALVGCNTMRGVGQDLQKAGESIEQAAKRK